MIGSKIRRMRRDRGMTQVGLAKRLEISPSYLNLIEHDQRAVTVPLLLALSGIFGVEVEDFSEDDEARLLTELSEAMQDPLFRETGLNERDLNEFVRTSFAACRQFIALYRAYRKAHTDVQWLSEQLSDSPILAGWRRVFRRAELLNVD